MRVPRIILPGKIYGVYEYLLPFYCRHVYTTTRHWPVDLNWLPLLEADGTPIVLKTEIHASRSATFFNIYSCFSLIISSPGSQ